MSDDVLADQVMGRPPLGESVGVAAVSDRCEVVGQGVEPDIGDVLVVPRKRDPPRDAGATDGEVAQAAADQAEGFVAPELRHDRAGMSGIPIQQSILEAAESEEVVLLLDVFHGQVVDATQVAGVELVVGVVLLAGDAVLALVEVELDVAGVVAPLQQLGDADLVALLRRADEIVVGDVQLLPRLLVERGDRVGEVLWRLAGGFRGLLHLLAVLVGAGEEVHVLAEQAVPASDGIADDGGVGVAEVRLCGDVVNRCGEEVVGHD